MNGPRITMRRTSASVVAIALALAISQPAMGQVLPPPPANDDHAGASRLRGVSGSMLVDITSATIEAGEPLNLLGNDHSIWFRWVAPKAGLVKVDTCKGDYAIDTVLQALTFAGAGDFAAATVIASNDDYDDANWPIPFDDCNRTESYIEFTAVRGQTYYLQVMGYRVSSYGDFILRWELVGPSRPRAPRFGH